MAPADDEAKGAGDAPGPNEDAAPRALAGPDRHRLLALLAALVVLFPVLAKSGIWDPYELDAADLARRIAVRVFGAASLEMPNASNALPTLTDLRSGELGFTSMAVGFKLFGLRDWSGRLPLALWGLAGVMVLYQFLARLVDRRAGLYAAIALVTMPLYFMQARTMLGDIVTMSALVMAFCGLAGAMIDGDRRSPDPTGPANRGPHRTEAPAAPAVTAASTSVSAAQLAWLALGLVGLVAGYLSRGLIIGVAVPALGVGLAWVVLRGSSEGRALGADDAAGALALAIGAVALGLGLRAFFRATPDAPVARALGFAVLRKVPNDATFDLTVRQLGHALFPWSAFLPFAMGRLLRAPVEAPAGARDRETSVRVALLVGAAVAYGAFALVAPRAGNLPFTGAALLAGMASLAVLDLERGAPPSRAVAAGCALLGGVLCFDVTHEPERALAAFVVDKPQFPKSFETPSAWAMVGVLVLFTGLVAMTWWERQPERSGRGPLDWATDLVDDYRVGSTELSRVWNGNLLFGMVVIEAALVGLGAMVFIGKRVGWAPVEKLAKNFADAGLNLWWMIPLVCASLPAAWVVLRDLFRVTVRVTRLPRATFTMIAALGVGAALGFGYYPALAAQLSPKEAFESYAKLRRPGEPLALLGVRSRAAAYYAGGEVESFTDASRAFTWLMEKPSERRWLMLKADDLPKMNALYRAQLQKNLPVLDGRSSQILLASNQLGGHANESWLSKVVLDEPAAPSRLVDASFEDQLDAFGWDVTDNAGRVVQSVVPARPYHLRVYYKTLKAITGTWKAFVHIDGFQRRFNGDHTVLDGKYPMNLWHPGDVIVDDLEFKLEPNFTPGDYTVYFGFFAGETRFKVTRGANTENRVVAGSVQVR